MTYVLLKSPAAISLFQLDQALWSKRILVFVLICLTGLGIAQVARADDMAICAGNNGDLAIPACTRVTDSPRNSATVRGTAFFNRAVSYADRGDYNQAIADYNKALELQPDNALAFSNRGDAYYQKQDYALAINDYNKALLIKPGFSPAATNLALAHRAFTALTGAPNPAVSPTQPDDVAH
jgi:tetratricopeptide (TPR) repeat protein